MYERILVALDNSKLSQDIVKQVIALTKPIGAKLYLLNVLSSDEVMSPTMPLIPVPEYYPALSIQTLELYQEEWKNFQSKSLAALERFKAEAEAAGLEAECLQKTGRPGQTICETAHHLEIDLIVVGRRGHSVFDEMLIGSVSSYVIHHASCAVLVCNLKPKKHLNVAPEAQSCSVESVIH
jgi:nucleotide-binding universal stress UspA family protein